MSVFTSPDQDKKLSTWAEMTLKIGIPGVIALYCVYFMADVIKVQFSDVKIEIRAQTNAIQSLREDFYKKGAGK